MKLRKHNHMTSCHASDRVKSGFSCGFFSKPHCFSGQLWTKMQVWLKRKRKGDEENEEGGLQQERGRRVDGEGEEQEEEEG